MSKEIFGKKRTKKEQFICAEEVLERFDYINEESKLFVFPSTDGIDKVNLIKSFPLLKNGKVRHITTYETPNNELFIFQKKVVSQLELICKKYKLYSPFSYAYKKGTNTYNCVKQHLNSKYFLKLDIHNYFESMKLKNIYCILINEFKNDVIYNAFSEKEKNNFNDKLKKTLRCLTYHNKFPVGFVSSPLISEIYLSSFDSVINDFCISYNLVYTRYADDLIISSSKAFDYSFIIEKVNFLLKELSLSLNDSKTMIKKLANQGDYVHFLGLNIVMNNNVQEIRMGRTYIRKLAKLKVFGDLKNKYIQNKINGLECYLKYNDKKGYDKYLDTVNIYRRNKK